MIDERSTVFEAEALKHGLPLTMPFDSLPP
jgi:hypothetical protein